MARGRVKIEDQALNLVREHKEMAKASYESGMALKTDLLQAEIEETKSQHSLKTARNQLKMARKNLINTIGLKKDEIKLEGPAFTPEVDLNLDYLYDIAVEQRPEMKLTELNQEMTKTSLQLEERSNFPQVMLIGNYSWQGSELALDNGSGNIILTASVSLFDGGQSNIKEEKYEKELAKIKNSHSNLKNMIRLDIEQKLMKVKEHKNNIKLQEMNITKARESLKIERKRFDQGMGKIVDVLQAQTTLKQTKIVAMTAKYQYKMALFGLLQKTGQLVDYCEEVIENEK
jgi:outer membrane protein TolC